jgi:hypothetical protein
VRANAPFHADDLDELDEKFLSRASAVISMQEVHAGNHLHTTIGLRHDCDAGHSLATAVKMARWEADRGYRSTYYMLHTSPYWGAPGFLSACAEIACLGHEIGIHTDALAEALKTGGDPDAILNRALETLRTVGFTVRGVAGHGNPICNRDAGPGEGTFANDEQFVECARPQEGPPTRKITRGSVTLRLRPRPLADFGLDYEALVLGLPHPFRFSDSGGKWLKPGWDETVAKFQTMLATAPEHPDPREFKQLHLLHHPEWWAQAFVRQAVAA